MYASDTTAITGATGTFNCGGSPPQYHLHFEILSQYIEGNPDALSSRVSVNPMNYVNVSIRDQFSVFKNWSVTSNGSFRIISIDAVDYSNGYPDMLNSVLIYYRKAGTFNWTSSSMIKSTSIYGRYTYNLYVDTGSAYEILIAGRRRNGEYWSTFPSLKTSSDIGNSINTNITYYNDWVTMRVY